MYSYEHSVDLLFKIYCSIVVRRMYERYSKWKSLEHKITSVIWRIELRNLSLILMNRKFYLSQG
jgi:hypothetical protein